LFDVASGELRAAFGDVSGVQRLALSPDGSTLASGGLYGVQLWDLATQKERPRFARDVTRPVPSGLAFSPDGKTLAVASREKDKMGHTFVVRLLDAVTGKVRATLTKKTPLATDSANGQIAFAPGGILAVTRTETVGQPVGLTTLWDSSTGKELTTLRHGSHGYAVAFSPDGASLAAVGGSVQLWQRDPSPRWERFELFQGNTVQSLAFAPDGETLASGDWRGHVALWNPRTGALRQELTGQWIQYAVAFTPDGKAVAAVGGTYGHGAAHLWDTQTGKLRWSHNKIHESLSAIGIMPDGKTVIGGGYTGLYAWDMQTGSTRQKFPKHKGAIGAMAFAPDAKTLAIAGMGEGTPVSLWEVVQEAERAKLPKHPGGVRALAFTPDGRMLVTASQRTEKRGEKIRGEVQIWDLQTEKSLRTLVVPGGAWSVAVSPDGQLLAVGSGGFEEKSLTTAGHVYLWDLSSGKLLRTAEAADGAIAALAFAPDGGTLALASWDGTVRLWDVGSWLAAKVDP
ncbi:MAG TPA: WD40 repeat domain-containing protein, partial [Gemmataceae bacterium]|nr:WD40 repeat domain-containing protein [Gemmataceae bacterium]